jgi:cytochrome c oxidase assembly factor CtaG
MGPIEIHYTGELSSHREQHVTASLGHRLPAVLEGSWDVDPALVLVLALAAVVYVCGWLRLRARRPSRAVVWRLGAFVAGLGTVFVALASPIDTFADRLLVVHMVQHLLLLVVAPPLIVLGAPTVPVLLGLPAGRFRSAVGSALIWLGERTSHPLVGLVAISVAVWGWHLPAAFELALRSPAWHWIEHASFFGAGLLFWWPVVQPWPSRPRWPRWAMIPYLLLADMQNTVLAALLVFSGRVLYPSYALGGNPLEDQAAAGVLMWVPMSIAYLIPAGVLTLRILAPRTLAAPSSLRSPRAPSSRVQTLRLGSGVENHPGSSWRMGLSKTSKLRRRTPSEADLSTSPPRG